MPRWLEECESSLAKVDQSGFYPLKSSEGEAPQIRFMVTGEVDAEFRFRDQFKRVHLLIFCPSLEVARQVTDVVSKYGDINSDGRPKLHVTPPELVEAVMEVDAWNEVVPAHIWTPFYSLFGSRSGFDRIEDCFQDQTNKIHAIETGLSSDPPMNWRLSCLDRFTLVSNSDSHSPWPYRLGREANVLELSKVTYYELVDAIRRKDTKRFRMTIETDPCYGKYHYTGHRNCNLSLGPMEASKYNGLCPICRKKLTVGVLDRVEELADREQGCIPEGAVPYASLIPLQEILAAALGAKDVFAKGVWEEHAKLLKGFANEFHILLEAPIEGISSVSGPRIADAILRVRQRRVKFRPGYDGLYGYPLLFEDEATSDRKVLSLEAEKKASDKRENDAARRKQKPTGQGSISDYF